MAMILHTYSRGDITNLGFASVSNVTSRAGMQKHCQKTWRLVIYYCQPLRIVTQGVQFSCLTQQSEQAVIITNRLLIITNRLLTITNRLL